MKKESKLKSNEGFALNLGNDDVFEFLKASKLNEKFLSELETMPLTTLTAHTASYPRKRLKFGDFQVNNLASLKSAAAFPRFPLGVVVPD